MANDKDEKRKTEALVRLRTALTGAVMAHMPDNYEGKPIALDTVASRIATVDATVMNVYEEFRRWAANGEPVYAWKGERLIAEALAWRASAEKLTRVEVETEACPRMTATLPDTKGLPDSAGVQVPPELVGRFFLSDKVEVAEWDAPGAPVHMVACRGPWAAQLRCGEMVRPQRWVFKTVSQELLLQRVTCERCKEAHQRDLTELAHRSEQAQSAKALALTDAKGSADFTHAAITRASIQALIDAGELTAECCRGTARRVDCPYHGAGDR